jgi:hypothetical protein
MEVSGMLHAPAALLPEKEPQCTHCIWDWLGPREGKEFPVPWYLWIQLNLFYTLNGIKTIHLSPRKSAGKFYTLSFRSCVERAAGRCIWPGATMPTLHSTSVYCWRAAEALLSRETGWGDYWGGVFVDVPSNFLTLLLSVKITVPSIVQLILVCFNSPSTGPGYVTVDIYTTVAVLSGQPEGNRKESAVWVAYAKFITGKWKILHRIAMSRSALRGTESLIGCIPAAQW